MRQIKCLTSLRFFAASMIVVYHSADAFGIFKNRNIQFPLAHAVSFFFVLSGFILAYVYPSLSEDQRIRDFYIARIARIWPAHIATFLLLLLLIPSGAWIWSQDHSWRILAANLLLVHAWIPVAAYYFSFNSVSWSISTEFFFYLSFPLLNYRLDRTWWWKLLCAGAFVAALLCFSRALALPPYDPARFSVVTDHGFISINPLVRILEFVFGMVVAILFLRWRKLKILNSLPEWLWTFFELGALAGALWFAWGSPWLYRTLFARQSLSAFAMYANTSGSFPAFGVLIGVLAFEKGFISRLLSAGWLVLLGEISYSIYLIHQILIRWYDLHRGSLVVIPRDARYAIFWLVVLVASLILWSTVERPCQRWIRNRLRISARLGSALQNHSQTSATVSASSTSSVNPAGGS